MRRKESGPVENFGVMFTGLPKPLKVVFLVFLLIPFISLASIEFHTGQLHTSAWRLILFFLTYWAIPLLLCFSIIGRHYLFLPFYVLQCLLLFIHCFAYRPMIPDDLVIVRFLMVSAMAFVGCYLANKDFLYPFLSIERRGWRRAFRFPVHVGIHLFPAEAGPMVPALMENCSLTGISISLKKENALPLDKEKWKPQNQIRIVVPWSGANHVLPFKIMWSFVDGDIQRVGLATPDASQMRQFIHACVTRPDSKSRFLASNGFAFEHNLKPTALLVWVALIVLAFTLPFIHL